MAHFAQLDENNVVLQVLVVNNNDMLNADGQEEEIRGIDLLQSLLGKNTKWVQTSYNRNFRRYYASPGGIYNAERDVFIQPKPYDSWILNSETLEWEAPVPLPSTDRLYLWEENTRTWRDANLI